MSHRKISDFAEIASDWFWETDADHRFVYLSERLTEALGIDPAEFLGTRRNEVPFQTAGKVDWEAHLADLSAHRPFRNFTYSAIRPSDGRQVWVRISGAPQFDTDGRFLGYIGVGSDATNEIDAQRKLIRTNAELSRRNRELTQAKRAIEDLAQKDSMTGLANHRALHNLQAVLTADNTRRIGVIRLDLDRFKQVNDTFGHAVGDQVLVETAERLTLGAPEATFVGRTGGDEFVLIDTRLDSEDQLIALGNSLVVQAAQPVRIDGQTVRFGASVGVATGRLDDTPFDEILARADIALYEAKKQGRGLASVFTPKLHRKVIERRELADEFQHALDDGQIRALFQPQFCSRTGRVVGAEALARWYHPTRGLLPPSRFLETAEALDMLVALDRQVMIHALAVASRLADGGTPLPRLSLNASFRRLVDKDFVTEMATAWSDRRTPLSIELVETIFFDDGLDPVTRHNIDRLSEMGIRIEMDDFGSGHASITGLLQIRPDVLKIDRALIGAITEDDDRRALLAAILHIAEVLDMEVVAEGVETTEQADLLEQMGCGILQGFALAEPMEEAELARLLAEHRTTVRQDRRAG